MSSQHTIPTHPTLLSAGVQAARRCPFRIDTLGSHAWAALAATLLMTIITSPAPESGGWIWAIALFFIGMPHGGYDLDAIRQTTRGNRWRATLRPFTIYSLIMGASIAALVLTPTAALLAFLLLTIHHFGHSDSVWTRHNTPPPFIDRLSAWGHGTIVIAAPFLFFPAAAWAPFEAIANTLGTQIILTPEALKTAAAVMLAAAALALILGIARLLKAHRHADALRQSTVLALAFALAAVAPPLLTVGAYFLAVHAAAHCLTATSPPRTNAGTPSLSNFCRVHARSLPLLLPSIAIVLGLTALFTQEPSLLNRITLAFLLFCAAATLPHHMLWAGSKLLSPAEP